MTIQCLSVFAKEIMNGNLEEGEKATLCTSIIDSNSQMQGGKDAGALNASF